MPCVRACVQCSPEIGVASTKAYTSQVLVMVLIGLMMCEDRVSFIERRTKVIEGLIEIPAQIRAVVALNDKIQEIASRYADTTSMLLLGRGYTYANCLEGALKIKELTYIHAEGILAGELKHGPLALIEPKLPIIMVSETKPNQTTCRIRSGRCVCKVCV